MKNRLASSTAPAGHLSGAEVALMISLALLIAVLALVGRPVPDGLLVMAGACSAFITRGHPGALPGRQGR
ncbi:hypothetical protein [Kitasatospora cineracea]|uniref:Uncharacterized protein n=1 Tax=Kitasatospora cineracea TaxID=88074 RepID=A0A8G1UH28_9ACTN|nr:hypothetical protein [Kitasatospora cineracea]ROR42914.1 hypothetical protein EDD39_1048 [Kitasatospora cineracea]